MHPKMKQLKYVMVFTDIQFYQIDCKLNRYGPKTVKIYRIV